MMVSPTMSTLIRVLSKRHVQNDDGHQEHSMTTEFDFPSSSSSSSLLSSVSVWNNFTTVVSSPPLLTNGSDISNLSASASTEAVKSMTPNYAFYDPSAQIVVAGTNWIQVGLSLRQTIQNLNLPCYAVSIPIIGRHATAAELQS